MSTSFGDTSMPITGICLVSNASGVPTGYQCIRKVYDDNTRDADLMGTSLRERTSRFLCITRIFPLSDNAAYIFEDIKIINERDIPPTNYIALQETVDTKLKGTSKRTIFVKVVERQAGMNCICDIIFLYRSKRPPQFYTLIGEINGLQMCVKQGTVPPMKVPTTETKSNIYPTNLNSEPTFGSQQQRCAVVDNSNPNAHSKRSDEKDMLEGVPFEINRNYLGKLQSGANNVSGIESFHILSPKEIDELYHYDFAYEKHTYRYLSSI